MNAHVAPQSLNRKTALSPTFVDVFAGCGGLSLGLMSAGWRGVFAVERDGFAFETLKANLISRDKPYCFEWPEWLPQEPIGVAELLAAKRNELRGLAGKVDMLVGGPPCQGFSSAGRRDASDPRNRLVEAYLEMVKLIEPKVVLIENVRGITSDFKDEAAPEGTTNYAKWIISALSKRYEVATRMIDTSRFGVAQKRHRFFVVAIRRDVPAVELPFDVLEASRTGFLRAKGIAAVPVSARLAISDLEVARNGTRASRDTDGFSEIAYRGPVTTYQLALNKSQCGPLGDTRLARHKPEIVARFREIIELCHAEGRLNTSLSPEMRASFGLRKCAIRVMDPEGPAPTVTSMPDDLIHYAEPRTLTVRENARLQSFPDWFEFHGKYTTGGHRRRREVPRFTQVANAVPPLMAEAIGLAILRTLSGSIERLMPRAGTSDRKAPDTLGAPL